MELREGEGLPVIKAARVTVGAVGVLIGLVWFVVVSAASVYQHRELTLGSTTGALVAVVAAALVSALCVLVIRAGESFLGWSVSAGIGVGLLLGFIEGPVAPEGATPQVVSVPTIFSVGLGSTAVWVVLGASVALSLAARRSSKDRSRQADLEQV